MWTYTQRTGRLRDYEGRIVATGYSGAGAGKNNPAMQDVHDVGPIPVGVYTMRPPVDTHTHGPYVLWLAPAEKNEMCGRSAFGIHGDSVVAPGTASEGCVILPRAIRQILWASGDRTVNVIAEEGGA